MGVALAAAMDDLLEDAGEGLVVLAGEAAEEIVEGERSSDVLILLLLPLGAPAPPATEPAGVVRKEGERSAVEVAGVGVGMGPVPWRWRRRRRSRILSCASRRMSGSRERTAWSQSRRSRRRGRSGKKSRSMMRSIAAT